MRTHTVFGALALATLAAITTGCGSHADQAETQTIHGTLTLASSSGPFGIHTCGGTGGYSDIRPDTQATLTDSAGAIVSTTRIGGSTSTGDGTAFCEFKFNFPPVEITSDFYSVEVSHRGKITKSVSELTADGWTFGLSLGI